MTYSLRFEIPTLPTINPNARRHWGAIARENKALKQFVAIAVGRKRPEQPLTRARVYLTRCSSAPPDFDNLATSFKPILDGLTQCGVIADDNHDVIETFVDWQKAKPRAGFVIVQVVELI